MSKKVAVGLSGGIDSSVAAYLLKSLGYEVVGFTLKFFPQENRCCDLDSLYQAQRLCDKLSIPHYTFDAGEVFKKEIINSFINSYLNGLTPNPCTFCNKLIKFGFFFDRIKALNVDYLATGHYVSLVEKNERLFLKTNKDKKKSQEYFLAMLEPEILKNLIFPLADYDKAQVKQIAKDKNLLFKERKESQDVCFVVNKDYSEFIEESVSDFYKYTGQIKHVDGRVLGQHRGIYKYTYGQRQGLGLAWSEPLYVVGINEEHREVIVGEKEHLYREYFEIKDLNWFTKSGEDLFNKDIMVKVRYNSDSFLCQLKNVEEKLIVYPKEKVGGIAPGQVAVFYEDDLVLGAGIIAKTVL